MAELPEPVNYSFRDRQNKFVVSSPDACLQNDQSKVSCQLNRSSTPETSVKVEVILNNDSSTYNEEEENVDDDFSCTYLQNNNESSCCSSVNKLECSAPKKKQKLLSEQLSKIYCPECESVFCSVSNLNRHIQSQHASTPANDPNRLQCSQCGAVFSTNSYLDKHLRAKHPESLLGIANKIQCSLCPAVFSRVSNLNKHTKVKHPRAEDIQSRKQCPECGAFFTWLTGLKRHVQQKHPSKVQELIPVKTYKFNCRYCHRRFNRANNLTNHERIAHNIKTEKKLHKCPVCYNEFEISLINQHLDTDHDIQLKTEVLRFESYDEFVSWKCNIERDTNTYFAKRTTQLSPRSAKYHYYYCHRSGTFTPKGTGKKRLKSQGSNKMNAYCPAMMKVSEVEGNVCEVIFRCTHVGHTADIVHLSLSNEERKEIASMLASDLPAAAILEEVRNSVSTDNHHRIHHLTRKDLYSIKKSYGLITSSKRDHSDHSDRRKKLSKFFSKLIASATSEELEFLEDIATNLPEKLEEVKEQAAQNLLQPPDSSESSN